MSEIEQILKRMEARQIFRNKLIQSIILLTVIVAPLTSLFWCMFNNVWKEEWRRIVITLGVYTIVIGTVVLCAYVLYRIWWD